MTNRRTFLKQTSLLALAPALARAEPSGAVVADTAFGKVRGEEVQGIKNIQGRPLWGFNGRPEPLHAA